MRNHIGLIGVIKSTQKFCVKYNTIGLRVQYLKYSRRKMKSWDPGMAG
jgi:hypothetical protein